VKSASQETTKRTTHLSMPKNLLMGDAAGKGYLGSRLALQYDQIRCRFRSAAFRLLSVLSRAIQRTSSLDISNLWPEVAKKAQPIVYFGKFSLPRWP